MNEFMGKKIVLTGASRGIGLSLMQKLSDLGAELIVVARQFEPQSQKLNNVSFYQADLTDKQQLLGFVDYIQKKLPKIDYLINNVGIQTNMDFFAKPAQIDMIDILDGEIKLNFSATVFLTLQLLPLLMKNSDHHHKAKIVNVGSALARAPKMSSPTYAGTKAAIEAFSRGLKYQCEGRAIDVQVVVPDVVATGMTKDYAKKPTLSADEAADQILNGMQGEEFFIFLGRAKLLYLIHRIWPKLAYKIIRRGSDDQYLKVKNKILDI